VNPFCRRAVSCEGCHLYRKGHPRRAVHSLACSRSADSPPVPSPELLRHLSTMATGELLQSHLTGRAKFVGANDGLPTDERSEIDAREMLSASWTHRRVRDVARRRHDSTEALIARQSPNLGTAEWWTLPGGQVARNTRIMRMPGLRGCSSRARWISGGRLVGPAGPTRHDLST
jgi:hypothetical protein